jgi:hypothetical protein
MTDWKKASRLSQGFLSIQTILYFRYKGRQAECQVTVLAGIWMKNHVIAANILLLCDSLLYSVLIMMNFITVISWTSIQLGRVVLWP